LKSNQKISGLLEVNLLNLKESGRWNHFEFGGILPNLTWINSFSQRNPVFLVRKDGHQALANSFALKLANVTKYTESPQGGEIEKNELGELTGILKENAMNLISKVLNLNS
jgi:predicted amidohydrolase YtcJ